MSASAPAMIIPSAMPEATVVRLKNLRIVPLQS
jgi:hypothetical protein